MHCILFCSGYYEYNIKYERNAWDNGSVCCKKSTAGEFSTDSDKFNAKDVFVWTVFSAGYISVLNSSGFFFIPIMLCISVSMIWIKQEMSIKWWYNSN